jgi:YidC/Oxa1 family membrane protein insertase
MTQLGQEEPIGFGRLILTTVLIAVVFIIWAFFFTPKNENQQSRQQLIEKKEVKDTAAVTKKEVEAKEAVSFKSDSPLFSEKEESAEIENENIKIKFSNRGAVLVNALLKKYKEKGSQTPDDLVSPLSLALKEYPLAVLTGDDAFDKKIKEELFHMEQSEKSVVFSWSDGAGNSIIKKFSLLENSYLLNYEISGTKEGKPLETVFLSFGPGLGKLTKEQAKNKYFQQEYVGYEAGGKFEKAVRSKKAAEPYTEEVYGAGATISWSGIANNYFAAIFLPNDETKTIRLRTIPLNEELKKIHPADSDIILLSETEGSGAVYLGPKDYTELKKLKGNAFRMMNWGWGWFSEICYFLLWVLKKLYFYSHNYGVAILLLTLIVKLFFYPFTQTSMVKMKEMGDAMKKLKPQIDKIKAKYKKQGLDMQSRAKMNEEIMALYQKEGVNPLGGMSGCLPLLLQMPIFWALFTMLPNTIDLRGAHFMLWIKDLSLPDPLYITPVLMGISMLFSTKMTSTQQVETSQKVLLYFMPIMFTWFCLWAPAGLTLYWLTNNILTMGQQYIINKQVEKRALLNQKNKKSTPKGPSRPS